jgi:uncharacterized protein (DUF362 family)
LRVLVKVSLTAVFATTFCYGAENQAPAAPLPTPTPVPARSIVVRTESPDAIFDYKTNNSVVARMVNDVVMSVTGEGSVAAAWASLVKPSDIVGIKVSGNGAPLFSTRPAVVQAIVNGLREAGVSADNIVVWDREEELLKKAGFHSRVGDYRVLWSEGNYDPQVALSSPVSGQLIYGDLFFVGKNVPNLKEELKLQEDNKKNGLPANISNESHVSKVLTKVVTKVINVPVMADNIYCGLSGALFNMTVQNVDNWRRLIQPPDSGDPSIPEMYSDPRISQKIVLTIMDGLVALYAGAPFGDANYAIHFGTIYASKDPVAIDAVASKQLDKWRVDAKMDPVSKTAKYVETAASMQLGNAELNRIEVRDIR